MLWMGSLTNNMTLINSGGVMCYDLQTVPQVRAALRMFSAAGAEAYIMIRKRGATFTI